MSGYDPNSCNTLSQNIYTPIEAAILWCNLSNQKQFVLDTLMGKAIPPHNMFRNWPCLRTNTLRIIDGIEYGNLDYGRDGKLVPKGEHVNKDRLTIRHVHLRKWIEENYPNEKPAFLFDETERATHSAINKDSFLALQADLKAKKVEIERITKQRDKYKSDFENLEYERDSLKDLVAKSKDISPKVETTYLNIIGAMVDVILNEDHNGKPYSVFRNNDNVIQTLLGYHEHAQGISARTLQQKFAEAKRSIRSS